MLGQRRPGIAIADDSFDRAGRAGDVLERGGVDGDQLVGGLSLGAGNPDRRAGTGPDIDVDRLDSRP